MDKACGTDKPKGVRSKKHFDDEDSKDSQGLSWLDSEIDDKEFDAEDSVRGNDDMLQNAQGWGWLEKEIEEEDRQNRQLTMASKGLIKSSASESSGDGDSKSSFVEATAVSTHNTFKTIGTKSEWYRTLQSSPLKAVSANANATTEFSASCINPAMDEETMSVVSTYGHSSTPEKKFCFCGDECAKIYEDSVKRDFSKPRKEAWVGRFSQNGAYHYSLYKCRICKWCQPGRYIENHETFCLGKPPPPGYSSGDSSSDN